MFFPKHEVATVNSSSNFLFCWEKMPPDIIALTLVEPQGEEKQSKGSAGQGWLSARESNSQTQMMGSALTLSYLLDDKAKLDRNKCNQSLSLRLQDKTQGISSAQWLILFFRFLLWTCICTPSKEKEEECEELARKKRTRY